MSESKFDFCSLFLSLLTFLGCAEHAQFSSMQCMTNFSIGNKILLNFLYNHDFAYNLLSYKLSIILGCFRTESQQDVLEEESKLI